MKFCVIGPTHPFRGGIAQHTTLLCRHLAEKHEVSAVSFKRLYPSILFPGKSQIDQSLNAVSFEAPPLIDSMNPITWSEAGKHIRESKPDMLIVEWWHAFFAPCITSILSKAHAENVLFICHNVLPHEPKPFIKPLTIRALKNGDSFVVHAGEEEEILKGLIPNARVVKTPLPVLDVFPREGISKEDARKRLGIEGRTIIFFGLVRKYKGLIDLIHAMPLLKDMKINCLVVGEFYENKQDYVSEIERLGVSGNIRLIDEYVPNESVEPYFAASDVVVLPYRSATQSAVVQVAYTFDRPVIATKVGGLPEAVIEGKSGMLVPSQDPQALAGAIRRFFDESMEFSSGVRDALEMFSWDRTVGVVESLVS